ncbi:cytochrome c [Burkholderia sp. Ac-20353]|uniref:c-type cytochrome n=1 Tax=Burkholderia sp. Ac-20353 TaxID=2703894 RepID=UPI00197B1BB1|nr:cytochrome c [Burkholderia sp. Ac-20353]MBN3792177.1 cytochrome c [Burkholderia sp. Ac-20353]
MTKTTAALLLAAMTCALSTSARAAPPTATLQVELPGDVRKFPPGPGADLADLHCLLCHSVGMVTRQPPLSFDEWKAEVVKMRAVYGAPLPPDAIDDLARYLTSINGKP